MRSIGFILLGLGVLAGLATKVSVVASKLAFLPKTFFTYGFYVAIALVALGVLVLAMNRNSSKQTAEVPIYQGNRIVGYRRA